MPEWQLPRQGIPVTLIATGTAIYQGFLVPMRSASVLRPSTQALDGLPCPPASRLGPPLAARLRLTLHSGPLFGYWPVRPPAPDQREGWLACFETPSAGAALLGVVSGSCPARPCATPRRGLPLRREEAPSVA